MIIKKYRANTVEEAMALMRNELGPDAVVLTTRKVSPAGFFAWFSGDRMEVTAGVEQKNLEEFTQKKNQNPTSTEALNSNLSELQQSLTPSAPPQRSAQAVTYGDPRIRTTPRPSIIQEPRIQKPRIQESRPRVSGPVEVLSEEKEEPVSARMSLGEYKRRKRQEELQAKSVEVPRERRFVEKKKEEFPIQDFEVMRQMIREEMERSQKSVSVGPLKENDEEIVGSVRFLVRKGVSLSIAKKVGEELEKQYGVERPQQTKEQRKKRLRGLKRILSSHLHTAGPILLRKGECTKVAIVGPTGVGKTTTLAKIAAQYSQELGRKVGILSLDTQKLGAREQIHAIASQLHLSHFIASNSQELQEGLHALAECDLLLIDTAGQSQYRMKEVDKLKNLLDCIDDLHVILAVSATTKDVDLLGSLRQFSSLQPDCLLVTKLDETIAYGVLVNLCERSRLPIGYVTTGQSLHGDLEIADPEKLARGILVENNNAECLQLLKLVNE